MLQKIREWLYRWRVRRQFRRIATINLEQITVLRNLNGAVDNLVLQVQNLNYALWEAKYNMTLEAYARPFQVQAYFKSTTS